MVKELTPYTVTIKKFKHDKEGFSNIEGTLCFKNRSILSFESYKNALSNLNLRVVVLNVRLVKEILASEFKSDAETKQDVLERFIFKAAAIHYLKKEVSKRIREQVKSGELYNKLSTGAYVFLNESRLLESKDYQINLLNDVYFDMDSEQLADLKEEVKFEGLYESYKEIYFMKYTTENVFSVFKLK